MLADSRLAILQCTSPELHRGSLAWQIGWRLRSPAGPPLVVEAGLAGGRNGGEKEGTCPRLSLVFQVTAAQTAHFSPSPAVRILRICRNSRCLNSISAGSLYNLVVGVG